MEGPLSGAPPEAGAPAAGANGAAVRYPDAPWRMHGPLVLALAPLPVEAARRHLPPNAPIVPVAPGKTLGGVLLVRYEERSTLTYHELIVFGGTVRTGLRPGLWVSHIYVDDRASQRGGREIWGMPKELADFELAGDPGAGSAQVRAGGRSLIRIASAMPRVRLPLPVLAPLMSGLDRRRDRRFTLARSIATLGVARARIDVPEGSPFADLGLPAGAAALVGRAHPLVMPPPAVLG